jgi:hypothetical protein
MKASSLSGLLGTLACLCSATALQAQGGYVGAGFGAFGGSGEGIRRTGCGAARTAAGYGVWAGYDVVGRTVALQGTVRFHGVNPSHGCGIPERLPENGTFLVRQRRNLLQDRFVSTDLRVRIMASDWKAQPLISVGAGQAWREESNIPYLMISGGVGFPMPFGVRVGVEGTLYQARVRFDDFQRTYQDFRLISQIPLGSVREWRTVRSATVFLELPLGR